MTEDTTATDLTEMTADIVSAFVSQNRVEPGAIAALIVSVHTSLSGLGNPAAEPVETIERPTAAQVRKSVSDAGLISFLDGKTYQSLKRHLTTRGLTPANYRERFGLASTYPMVAPAYAAKRSALAKAAGLGQGGRKPAKKAGRPKKS